MKGNKQKPPFQLSVSLKTEAPPVLTVFFLLGDEKGRESMREHLKWELLGGKRRLHISSQVPCFPQTGRREAQVRLDEKTTCAKVSPCTTASSPLPHSPNLRPFYVTSVFPPRQARSQVFLTCHTHTRTRSTKFPSASSIICLTRAHMFGHRNGEPFFPSVTPQVCGERSLRRPASGCPRMRLRDHRMSPTTEGVVVFTKRCNPKAKAKRKKGGLLVTPTYCLGC